MRRTINSNVVVWCVKVSSSASVLDHTTLNRILQLSIKLNAISHVKCHLCKFQMKLDLHQLKLFKRVTSAGTNRVKGCGHVSHWYKKIRTTVQVNQNASCTLLHFAGLCELLELQQCLSQLLPTQRP